MTGPGRIAGTLAALMIVIAIGCACRLVAGRVRGKNSDPDIDGLHLLMGAAMAGMFEPRLSPLPGFAWQAIFAIATAWFGWQAIRMRTRTAPGHSRLVHPLPHAVESAAMIYMLWPHQPGGGATGMAMSAMTGPAAASARNPIVPLALALFMIGYIVWTADHLTSMQLASRLRRPRKANGRPVAVAKPDESSGRLALAPRFAASYKIAMGIVMGYMLVSMLQT